MRPSEQPVFVRWCFLAACLANAATLGRTPHCYPMAAPLLERLAGITAWALAAPRGNPVKPGCHGQRSGEVSPRGPLYEVLRLLVLYGVRWAIARSVLT